MKTKMDFIVGDFTSTESLNCSCYYNLEKRYVPELGSELTPLIVTHIARRGPDQLRHFMLLLKFQLKKLIVCVYRAVPDPTFMFLPTSKCR
jgi:hypothetical protein